MKRSLTIRLAGMAAAALMQAVSYLLLARMLGAAQFGQFAALFAVGSLVSVLSGFGFTPLALRLGSGADAARVRSTMVCIRLAVTAMIVALLAAVATTVGTAAQVVGLAVAFVAVDAMTDLCQACLAGARRIAAASAMLVAQRLAMLAAISALTLAHLPPGVLAAAAVTIVAANVGIVVRARPAPARAGRLILSSRGYWAANTAASISQLEIPMIVTLGGGVLGGLYAAGARAASPINLVAQAILQIATPDLTRADGPERWKLFLSLRRATAWLVLTGAVVALPAGMLVAWVLGDAYAGAWATVAGFVVGGAIMGANQAHQALLLAVGRAGESARCVAIGAVAGVAAAAVLAGTVGMPWIAVVPVIAQGTMHLLFRRAAARG